MCPFLKLSAHHSRSCSLSFSWIHTVVSPDHPVPFFLTSCQPSPPGHVAAWCPSTAGWPRGMYSCASLREQLLGIHGPHTLEKGIPWGPLSHRPPQINTELVFWSSHAAIKYGWNWPMSSEETWRREVGTLFDRWRNWMHICWLSNWNISNGLGSKCLPRRFRVSSLPLCPACARPQLLWLLSRHYC